MESDDAVDAFFLHSKFAKPGNNVIKNELSAPSHNDFNDSPNRTALKMSHNIPHEAPPKIPNGIKLHINPNDRFPTKQMLKRKYPGEKSWKSWGDCSYKRE